MKAFDVVVEFEKKVAEYAGSRYAVAVDCCTNAIFLCLQWLRSEGLTKSVEITLPAKTYCSVPMACLHAGFRVKFEDIAWSGMYQLFPFQIWDGAKRFRRGMYEGGLHCLSFHAKKLLNIGKGGMILTDDEPTVLWLRKARYDGREHKDGYFSENIEMLGWHCFMTPEQAARGLHLLEVYEEKPDQTEDYPDLRKMPVFQ